MVTFGYEIVVHCFIPWGFSMYGAKKFWALVYKFSKPTSIFSEIGAVLLEIDVGKARYLITNEDPKAY